MPSDAPPDRTWQYGPDPDQVADIYLPAASQIPRSTVVVVHGGFWRPVYDRLHVRPLAAALAARGHGVVSLDYRRTPGHPDATTGDVRSAVELLPRARDSLGLADRSVQLVGHSAGGHLVLWLAGEPGVTATVVALAPVADLVVADSLGLGGGAVTAFLGASASARPDLDPARRTAPHGGISVIHGALDDIVPVSVGASYVSAVAPAARLVLIPDCGHFELIDPTGLAWPVLTGELDRLADQPAAAGIE